MGSMHCRLYDENLVHNIIISTGLAVIDFLQKHNSTDADELCEYLEMHADSIIEDADDINFEAMTKMELEAWAREELDIELDRRKSKSKLISEIKENL